MCQPIRGPQYTSVSFLIKPLKYITNLDPNINLPSWTLPGRLPVPHPVCSLYFFCILMKPCDRALLVLPSTDKTIGLYALYLLDGNALYLHFFLFFWRTFKRFTLYWDGKQAGARPHHFYSTVFPCPLCCGKNRRKHQSSHLVYSSPPQRLVFFLGPLWSLSHICWVLHLLPAAARAHLLDEVQSCCWTVVCMHHSSNMLYLNPIMGVLVLTE